MTDEDTIIHVLNNLLEEYNKLVETMEIKLMNTATQLTLMIVREKLKCKYARLKKSRVTKKKNNEETALTAEAFLGRCYMCGQFSHKRADFPDEEERG